MPNKYIIHGATFCGDGTSPAEATSNGGVGALNSLVYFEGTPWPAPAVLTGGDVVYIRSKDAGGSNITRTLGASTTIGSASATEANPITWVIDDGTIWTGVSGVVTYQTSGAFLITVRDWNNLFATSYNLVFYANSTAYNNNPFVKLGKSTSRSLKIDASFATLNNGTYVQIDAGSHYDLWIRSHKRGANALIVPAISNCLINLFGPELELLDSTSTRSVFDGTNNYGGHILVFGGSIFGAGCSDNTPVAISSGNAGEVKLFGTSYPRNMPLGTTSAVAVPITANACDGAVGAAYWDKHYAYDSRDDNNYPKRQATLETSVDTKWSYKLYPYNPTRQQPAQVAIGKLYTQTAAAKTITLEFLWPTTFSSPTSDKVFAEIQYTDSSGTPRYESTETIAATPLSSSSVTDWSATTYGAVSLQKYKIEVVTDYSIKQDTQIMVVFMCRVKSASANDIIFIDPDFSVA